jgi:serine/threonine-protein kinase
VTIYEYGQSDEGAPYIAMEYLEGNTLRQVLKSGGALPLSEAVEIVRQVAKGLNAAHKLGIIHRDLKPDNVFVTEDDEGQRLVKVMDFGIAKLRESVSRTLTGVVMGTPPYMSFEQASGMRSDELDARSDVYSLGIVTYEVLTGRVPFHADTPLGYIRKHMTEEPPTIYSVRPDLPVPQTVEAVVRKALRKEREERYPTTLDFARELREAVLGGRMAPRTRIPRTRPTTHPTASPPVTAEDGAAGTAVATPPTPGELRLEAPPHVSPARKATLMPERVPAKVPPHKPLPAPSLRPMTAVLGFLLLGAIAVSVWLNWHSVRQLFSARTAQPTRSPAPEPILPPPGMVGIPGQTFIMGRADAKDPEETPAHSVDVPPFYLDKTPVTNHLYREFVRTAGIPGPPQWTNTDYPSGQDGWPVANVSWHEAQAYCEARGGRLPTEAEWEFAARGSDRRLYPWGNEFDSRLANTAESGLEHPGPVGLGGAAASPFGVLDMSGNVWEWCEDDYMPYPGHQSAFKIPAGAKAIRGGSYMSDKEHVTTTTRNLELATTRSPRIGFRCAKSK